MRTILWLSTSVVGVKHLPTVTGLAHDLANGIVTSMELVDEALERIADPTGEGANAFLLVDADRARAAAASYDAARAEGVPVPPYAGIPFAVKDLADVPGQVTTAGSIVLADAAPAEAFAPALERVVRAGFIPVGRTNMTEFAYSGIGINSHYPTPASPWERSSTRRIPGGSSSGTAVAVADGMAVAGLGTDTGGSCRIPAAFCGIVGYKPTAQRVPLDGVYPLSRSLDSVGPLAPSVECCAVIDDLFAGGDGLNIPTPRPADRVRLAVISDLVADGLDPAVSAAFEASLERLATAGVALVDVAFPELNDLPDINAMGGLAAAEAFHHHRRLLAEAGEKYDPLVAPRIGLGQAMTAADYLDVADARQRLIAAAERHLRGFDAFVLPTVGIVAPTFDSFANPPGGDPDEYYRATNLMTLRNTSVGNFLDTCAISLPCHQPGEAPVGLMLMGAPGGDKDLFSVALGLEPTVSLGW